MFLWVETWIFVLSFAVLVIVLEKPLDSAAAWGVATRNDFQVDSAFIRSQTSSVLICYMENQSSINDFDRLQRILREDTLLVFDFDWDLLVIKKTKSFFDDLAEFGGVESMIQIVCHPDLEKATSTAAECATAIDETFLHMSNLSHVKVSWD